MSKNRLESDQMIYFPLVRGNYQVVLVIDCDLIQIECLYDKKNILKILYFQLGCIIKHIYIWNPKSFQMNTFAQFFYINLKEQRDYANFH